MESMEKLSTKRMFYPSQDISVAAVKDIL